MKKTLSKVLALILAVALVLPTLPTTFSAATWDNVPETNYASRYWTSDYATGKFYDNMTKIPLTGDGARDVVAVAASQMGYIEGDSAAGYDGETGGSTNYTEYGYYMGLTGGSSHAWCAAFCSWVFYTAEVTDVDGGVTNVEDGNIWAHTYVPTWSNYLYANDRYRFSDYYRYSYDYTQASYKPQPGDLIFFTAGYEPLDEGHIGLVAYSDDTYVYTLEGNTSSQDGVEAEGGGAFFKKYELSSSSIAGYGVMPYETVEGLPEIDYTGKNPTLGLYVNPSGAKSVYEEKDDAAGSEKATLPMSSVFEVSKIEKDTEGNTMLYSKCEINGETVYGWIVHGTADNGFSRTFQIYAAPEYDESIDADRDGIPDSYNPSKDDNGDYTFENAYGYEFDIDDVDGVIDGADATIITTADAYAACNPNWAISVQLKSTATDNEYEVVKVVAGSGSADTGINFDDGDIVMVVHSAGSQPGNSNWKDKVAAMALKEGDLVNVASDYSSVTVLTADDAVDPEDPDTPVNPDPEDPETPTVPDEVILYQTKPNSTDIRLVAYVDDLEKYSKVSFTLTMNGQTSKELACTKAYKGLYAGGTLFTTEQIYGVEGYFVAFTINRYLEFYAGEEVTITVTYTAEDGGTTTAERTVTIGTKEEDPEDPVVPDEPIQEAVTVTGNLTYANGYDLSDSTFYLNNVLAFASSDSTATTLSVVGQNTNFFQWWYGIVFDYDSANGTWKVVATDWENDGTNTVEAETLGSNRFAVVFHVDATGENVDFLKKYAVEGAEFKLNTDITTLQSASGALSGVTLSHTYYVEVENPDEGGTTNPDDGDSPSVDNPDQGGTTTPVDPSGVAAGQITSMNYYQWVDEAPLQKHIYGYASNTSEATPYSMNGDYTLFKTGYGIVFQYNSSTGKYKVISVDFDTTDNVNAAETQTLTDGILVVLFGEEAATGQPEAYTFFKNNAVVGAEFYLSTELSYIQYGNGATGSVSNLYLSLTPVEEDDDTTVEPADPIIGTISSTVTEYDSTESCTRSSGDTDGLSAVLYAPSGSTGISTWLNLGAVDTTLYASDEAAAKQALGVGTVTDKDVDNAYLYLCMNSTYWSGDFGLIKRLGDADWEIVTSEYFNSTWRWNAYSYPETSGVDVTYNEDYVYWKYNVMDGREALYIKDCENIGDLQMNLINSGNKVTFSIVIGTETVFSMSDSTTISSLTLGRAASLTNSNTTSYGTSNYLYQIASSLQGKTPAEMTNVQFYDTYYYTSSGYGRLTIDAGALWLYPNYSSNAGSAYKVNANGDPIVTCEEVILSNGAYMDIINIKNY